MDPISDFLTQIRNGYTANKQTVTVPHSKMKESLSNILSKAGYVGSAKVIGKAPKKTIDLELVYKDKLPVLTNISRVSKPSVRHYTPSTKIPYALSGKGMVIITTSKGLMTGREARKQGVGGEIICQVW